jgi:lipopolysaccharide transport system permease protein
MFVTPVIYPSSMVPGRWRWLLALNPLSAIVEGFRDAIFGRPLHWFALALGAALAGAILSYAAFAFRRMEQEFADFI